MEPCTLCGMTKWMKKPQLLYGHTVCRKCASRFCNRRQFGFLIDVVLIRLLTLGLAFPIVMVLVIVAESDDAFNQMVVWSDLGLMFVSMGLFLARDSLGGRSIGKLVTGVQVFDERWGEPAGLWASVKRNLPLLIPFAPLLAALNLMKGPRYGDGWAHTKVVWRRYADHPVFLVEGRMDEQPESDDVVAVLPDDPADPNPYRAGRF